MRSNQEKDSGKEKSKMREWMRRYFDPEERKIQLIGWIRQTFERNGPTCKAVIGLSGGKDSTVAAALCVKALGSDRVLGVLMPNHVQSDIKDSMAVADILDIEREIIDIGNTVYAMKAALEQYHAPLSEQSVINIPPRIRMATLYAVAQNCHGRVINTSNLSERFIGYSTRWGDNVGDFSPFGNLTASEVIEIGKTTGIPVQLVEKAPSDGLCGMTDEDRLGFTYDELDRYIRKYACNPALDISDIDPEKIEKIKKLHELNEFKTQNIPTFNL